VSFVESAGADLRVETEQRRRPQGCQHHPLRRERPGSSTELIELSTMRNPDGFCRGLRTPRRRAGPLPAGPVGLQIVVKGQSRRIFLARATLVKKWRPGLEESDDAGRSRVRALHAEVSGPRRTISPRTRWTRCASAREVVLAPQLAQGPGPRRCCSRRKEPAYDAEELLRPGQPGTCAQPVDGARRHRPGWPNGSRFEGSSKARYGPTVVCGWDPISTGYPGRRARQQRGDLTPTAAEKAAHFIQLCKPESTCPLLFPPELSPALHIGGR